MQIKIIVFIVRFLRLAVLSSTLTFTWVILVSAQQLYAVSDRGIMRMLLDPLCQPDNCFWVDIDRNPRTVAMSATNENIFQLHDNGAIWSWMWRPCSGSDCSYWQRIDRNPATRMIAGNNINFFQLHNNGSIWRWLGRPCDGDSCPSWVRLDRNPRAIAIAAAGDQLFQLHNNGSVWRWKGESCTGDSCGSWEMLEHNPRTRQIVAAPDALFQLHDNGKIWRWTGRPCSGRACPGWDMLDNNPNTKTIVATRDELFQLHNNGWIWRWRGSPCAGDSCTSWERLDNNSQTRGIVAVGGNALGAALFQVHQNGSVWRWTGHPCSRDHCPHWQILTNGDAFTTFNPSRGGLFAFMGNYDSDRDGLPDAWETGGYGPLDPSRHSINPFRQDVILVITLKSGMTRSQVEPTLENVRNFFSQFPGRNLDGTNGINVITVWGNQLSELDSTRPYTEVYNQGMPRAWRGIAHGLLIGPETGAGGQTALWSDWSGVSNNWQTIVHELGHQFGLGHEPPGSSGQSPLYTSLMNYDYDHSFDNDTNAVHFSQGKFASVILNEARLNETLMFPASDLRFLMGAPYHFQIRDAGPRTTHVDWNRNGIFGERSVRADINDGYAIGLHGEYEHRLGKIAGSPSLVTTAGRLLAIYPDLNNSAEYESYIAETLSPENIGRIVIRSYDGRSWTEKAILARSVRGDPHAVAIGERLFVTFPIANSYMIQEHASVSPFPRRSLIAAVDDIRTDQQRPILVTTTSPDQLWLFLWNSLTGTVSYRKVEIGTATSPQLRMGPVQELRAGIDGTSPLVTSQFPIHATYNTNLERIALVTSEFQGGMNGRMKLHTLGRMTNDRWYSQNVRWTMGDGGYSRSRARPWVLYDRSQDRGPRGGYLVYHKGDVNVVNATANIWLSRTIEDRSYWDGWRTNLMGNEWSTTRSAPAATFYGNDIAYAVRWSGGEIDNELLINLRASGVQDGIIADHDDVTHIRMYGLRRSLGR